MSSKTNTRYIELKSIFTIILIIVTVHCMDKKPESENNESADQKQAAVFNKAGLKMYQTQRFDDAIENFNFASKLVPKEAEYPNNTGMTYFAMGNMPKALDYFEKAIELNPKSYLYHYNTGIAYQSFNDLENALMHFEKSISFNDKHQDSYIQAASILLHKNNQKKAEEYLKESIKQKDNAHARALLGGLYLQQNKIEESQSSLKKSISLDNKQYLPFYNLAVIEQKREKYKRAAELYHKSIELNREYYPSYYNLGLMYIKSGHKDKAKQVLSQYLSILPPQMVTQKRDAIKMIESLD